MARTQQPFTAIIFDLGDVLFQWSAETRTSISPRTLRSILHSPTWFDYERGRLGEVECYNAVSTEFNIPPEEIRQAFQDARDSLQANHDLIDLIRELKIQSEGRLRIYAMSNISLPDWEVLRTKPADWSIFDEVFTSGAAGERKPNLGFYRHVIATTGVQPRQTIFVDDKLENVLSARSLGFTGVVFDSASAVKRALRNLIGDPVERGQDYLTRNAGKFESVTRATSKHEAVVVQENFAQLLILEATGDRTLVNLVEHPRTWNFFQGKGQLTTEEFPFDLDTTSLGLTILKRDKDTANSVMNEMLEYVDPDGIIQTYFDHRRPRFDPVVCVNALSLFYAYGRGAQVQPTLKWVHEVLLNRAYLDGTRYYETAECFLYFLSRLLSSSGDPELHALLKPLLKERVQERIGADGDSLALAMRILVCDFVGVRDEVDLRTLLTLQCEDGGWEGGWMYKYGSSGISIGNRGLATALAVKAVEAMSQSTTRSCNSPTPTLVGQSGSRRSSFLSKRPRSGSLKNSLQWLWHGGKMRKSVEIGS
ncbi:HAD-like protein [Macrolepiota fuliginosa MF-IS2]|uniref:HAD-like protein n=1 Tax=Macrolepiota fuliginosa MF-IS2 TaxID=1400762 RepID=A0A9P5XFI0_9AGAR|nr:HAD-like protein [Macrolepiota fuliginosa MF-IS2]